MPAQIDTVEVRVLAVHVECGRCGDQQHIADPRGADAFTRRVLQPLASWWVAHTEPEITAFELLVDGERSWWEPTR